MAMSKADKLKYKLSQMEEFMYKCYMEGKIISQFYYDMYDDMVEYFNIVAPRNTTYQLKDREVKSNE